MRWSKFSPRFLDGRRPPLLLLYIHEIRVEQDEAEFAENVEKHPQNHLVQGCVGVRILVFGASGA